ncbi:MAG TPA: L,D-transpeptidase [Longimicrobiaceae bacterium]
MYLLRKYLAVAAVGVAAAGAASPLPFPAQETGPRLPGEPVGRGTVSLVVDLSDRQLHVMRGGEVERSYSVAIGKPEHPTPTGEFKVRRMVWNPRWVPPDTKWARGKRARAPGDPRNPMGRVKIFFSDPDYYIHGTREVDSLGSAESHGCVRMRNAEVIEVARTVMEGGGASREPAWWKRVLNRVTHTQEVRLSDPVQVTVRE